MMKDDKVKLGVHSSGGCHIGRLIWFIGMFI